VYYKYDGGHFVVISLYVDESFFGNNKDVICDLKSQLSTQFDIKYLGATKYILEM